MAEPADGLWPVVKVLDQMDRYYVAYMLIHNWYRWRDDGGALPTLTALQKVVGLSPRQSVDFVAMLATHRFITVECAPNDRRAKLLAPCANLIAAIGRSGRLFVAAADGIERRADRSAGLSDHGRLGRLLMRSASMVLASGSLLSPFPRVLRFAERTGGYPLLAAVMGAYYAIHVPHAPEGSTLNARALAQRFGVSPTHVSNLLSESRQLGWFSIGSDGALTALADDLREEFEQWSAWQMAHYTALMVPDTSRPPAL